MKIIKLQGGLGNQMFQYAFARGLVAKTGQEISFDFSGLNPIKGVTQRSFSLDSFNIKIQKASDPDIKFFTQEKCAPLLTKIKRMFGFKIPSYLHENEHSFHPEVWGVGGDTYFDGYWQSEKYFLHIEKEIREAFAPRQPLSQDGKMIAEKINNSSISLHIRRGDYVTNKKAAETLGTCEMTYYQRALSVAIADIENPHIFIFSDDTSWVKESFDIPYQTTIVSEYKVSDWEEIILMSKCERHIISNSSFSWWGAWLDTKYDTIVIAPAQWTKDLRINNKDITPPSWIRI